MKQSKLTLIAICLACAFSAAHATGPDKSQPTPTPKAPKTVTSSATAAPSSASATALAPVSVQASPSASAGGSSVSVNTAASAPAIFGVASSPSPTTCDGAGWSIGGSGRAGGGLLNFPGGERESCLGAQDATTMRAAGFSAEDVQRRLCAVSTIKTASKRCKEFEAADARATGKNSASEAPAGPAVAVLSDDPLIRARQLRAAGGGN